MAKQNIEVKGAAAVSRKLGRFSKDVQREMQRELRKIAEPIAASTRSRAAKWGSTKTTSGIRAGSRRGAAVVRQRQAKTTGQHPEYGGMQMREAFLPALRQAEPAVILQMNHLLDKMVDRVNT